MGMLAAFGVTAFGFSMEWARIEPAEGEFSRAALGHYRRVLEACRDSGVRPVVTFHHFTLPRWLQDAGGFAAGRFPAPFERYCDRAPEAPGGPLRNPRTPNPPQPPSPSPQTYWTEHKDADTLHRRGLG